MSSQSDRVARNPLLLCSLLCLAALLSGCLGKGQPVVGNIQEPPYIPAPPAAVTTKLEREMTAQNVQAYADLLELEDKQHLPVLREAVSHAVLLGVLKPGGLNDRFDPARAITYGEFRDWVLAYQRVLYGDTLGVGNATDSLSGGSDSVKSLGSNPMSPEKLSILPSDLSWGTHHLSLGSSLTREELCGLYVVLSKQSAKAAVLTNNAVDDMQPQGGQEGSDESFSQFKDFQAVSPWAKPLVALAYRDRLLQTLFRLTPNRLIVDEGFNPGKAVSREEAIVLLHTLYGSIAPKLPQQQIEAMPIPAEGPQKLPEHATLNLPQDNAIVTSHSPTVSQIGTPLGRTRSFLEKGPNGSRSSIQISGPD